MWQTLLEPDRAGTHDVFLVISGNIEDRCVRVLETG